MKNSVSVLSTPTAETAGSSVLLAFDDKRYLFGNAHEGLQRACIQNGAKLGKLENIFLTGKTEWKTMGGLMGFLLTIADVMQGTVNDLRRVINEHQEKWEARRAALTSPAEIQKMERQPQPKDRLKVEAPGVIIHGGDNIMQLLATARRFIFRRGMPLKVYEHTESVSSTIPTWEDHNIQVWAIPLRSHNHNMDDKGKSPRKRSFDDYSRNDDVLMKEPEDVRTNQLQRIMGDMFDSNWRIDALFEMQLSEVKLPAAIFVRNPETKALEKYQGPLPAEGQDIPDIKVLVRNPWPGATVTELPATRPSPVSVSYIVKNQARRGKFNRELAIKLGVTPGPAFAELTKGATIKTASGQIITPEQVTGPTINGKGFAVIELPTVEYINDLTNSAAFKDETTMDGVEAVFWFLGPGITNNSSFQALIKLLPNRKHVISSVDHCADYLSMDAAAAGQLRHRVIDEARFNLPVFNNVITKLPQELSDCIVAHRGIKLDLAPEVSFKPDMEPGLLNTIEVVNRTSKAVKELSRKAHQELKHPDFIKAYQDQKLPDGDTEIVTLGTGSAMPSKNRNVSATLLRIPNVGSYLLDCGEGTLGQLTRIYPPDELQKILKDLKLIWISHMHADHHLGLTSLIKAWYTAVYGDFQNTESHESKSFDGLKNPLKELETQQRLCIVTESAMVRWLDEYSKIENFGYDKIIPLRTNPADIDENNNVSVPTTFTWEDLTLGFRMTDSRINTAMRKVTGLANLQSVYVNHCAGARAVSMTWPSGLKISYSGDCRPSKKFAVIGRDSTVLIHEATFDESLAGDAKAKKHSTTGEALGVGLEMRAKRIILTHFSQRYSKIPTMENIVAKPISFEEHTPNRSNNNTNTSGNEEITGLDEETLELPESTPADPKSQSSSPTKSSHQFMSPDLVSAVKEVKIGVAFDFMRVKVKDIIALDKFKAAFTKLYGEPDPLEDDEVAAKQAAAAKITKEREDRKKEKAEKHRQKQITASAEKRRRRSMPEAEAATAEAAVGV